MSYAPARLLELRRYLMVKTGLPVNSLGIVGDSDHDGGYHCGWDRRRIRNGVLRDYSWQESTRDSSHRTDAARAIDIGLFDQLREMTKWIVAECERGAPDTQDIRSIIYSPDGQTVVRWDRLRLHGGGDPSHRTHDHYSFFADAEDRDKTAVFKRFFKDQGVKGMILLQIEGQNEVWISDTVTYRHMTSPTALDAAKNAGYPLVVVPDWPDLEALGGKLAGSGEDPNCPDADIIRAIVREELDATRLGQL